MLPRRARRMAQTSGPPARPRRTGTGKPARAAGSEPTTIPSTMPQGAKFVTASSWAEFPSSAATRSGDGHRRRRSTHRRTADGHPCWPSFRYLFAQPYRRRVILRLEPQLPHRPAERKPVCDDHSFESDPTRGPHEILVAGASDHALKAFQVSGGTNGTGERRRCAPSKRRSPPAFRILPLASNERR